MDSATTHAAASTTAIIDLLAELVRIPSVNPLHAGPRSGDGGEAAMAQWLADRTAAMGAEVELEEVEPGRPNVYARFAGQTSRTLGIDVHLDTVGVEHMDGDPFDGRIDLEQQRVFGRGAVDTKATLAVVLCVLDEMRQAGEMPMDCVELVGTIAEEGGGLLGAGAYRDRLLERGEQVGQLIVAEPTMCAPMYGHKGGFGMDLVIEGQAAHSSAPELGINAIEAAARVVECVTAEQDRLISAVGESGAGAGGGGAGSAGASVGKVLGAGTVAVTEISGGRARNIIPDRCKLFVGRRTVDGEDPMVEFGRLSEMVRSAALPARVKIDLANNTASAAFIQSPESKLIKTLEELSGNAPAVANFGSNALRYSEIADQIVVFGPGSIEQAHSETEWIDIAQLAKAADIYRQLLRS